MTARTDTPTRYRIDTLLNRGVQPFPDLSEDEKAALGGAIGKGPLADPVTVTGDGILIDGHQRLKVMRARGKTWIPASDVRVVPQANEKNALEWAVRLNVQRRHLTVKDKAAIARQLQQERQWSQTLIGNVFGVTRAAVCQWLGQTREDGDDGPDEVIGKDGKVQSVASKRVTRAAVKPHVWSEQGDCLVRVQQAQARVLGAAQHPEQLDGLTDTERDVVRTNLQDLESSVDMLLAALDPEDS